MLKRLFSFEGRMGRLSYLGHGLLASAASLAAACLVGAIGGLAVEAGGGDLERATPALVLLALLLAMPVSLWAGAALAAKRLHDLGRSGAHAVWILGANMASALLPDTPDAAAAKLILGLVVIGAAAWLLLARGERGPNAYGSPAAAHPAGAVAA